MWTIISELYGYIECPHNHADPPRWPAPVGRNLTAAEREAYV